MQNTYKAYLLLFIIFAHGYMAAMEIDESTKRPTTAASRIARNNRLETIRGSMVHDIPTAILGAERSDHMVAQLIMSGTANEKKRRREVVDTVITSSAPTVPVEIVDDGSYDDELERIHKMPKKQVSVDILSGAGSSTDGSGVTPETVLYGPSPMPLETPEVDKEKQLEKIISANEQLNDVDDPELAEIQMKFASKCAFK